MPDLSGKIIAILATDGFEQSELLLPLRRLGNDGATIHIVSPQSEKIKGWHQGDWGEEIAVDVKLDEADPEVYDALILPGGPINPDLLRTNRHAIAFIRHFYERRKPLGAICHAPWLLIEADIVKGRRATSYASIKTDMENAGAHWVDVEVAVDDGLVTSRKPADLNAFCEKIAEEITLGCHPGRHAA